MTTFKTPTVLDYSEHQLVNELGTLPPTLRAAFAVACAQRLLPTYLAFSQRTGRGDPAKLNGILERLWQDLEGDKMSAEEIQENISVCMRLIPSPEDKPWVPEQPTAEDAAEALFYALTCRQTGDAQEAAWAARHAYEAVDYFVINQTPINTNEPHSEERVLSHPLVQSELARQHRDLEELLAATGAEPSDLVTRIRDRAKVESGIVFTGGNRS